MGIFGFLAASIFMVKYFFEFRNMFLQSEEKFILIGISAFIISCAVHNLFDSYHTKPAMLWPLSILAGAAIAQKTELKQSISIKRPWWILLIIFFSWFAIWSITPYIQAVELIKQNQWEMSFEKLQLAVKRDPHNGLIYQQIGIVASKLAADGNNEMVDNAIKAFESATKYEPGWALNYANLSNLYLMKGQFEKAEYYAKTAYNKASKSALFALNLSEILRQTGNIYQAKQAYKKTIELAPSWDTLNLQKKYEFSSLYDMDWYVCFPEYEYPTIEQIQIEIKNNPHLSRNFSQLAKIQIYKGDLETANHSLENANFRNNGTIDRIENEWLRAELLAKSGNFEEAIEIGYKAVDQYFNYGLYGPGRFGELQYAPNIFRMTANPVEIIPQMVQPPIPDTWIERQAKLNEWKRSSN
jgi:tetratricopeptide (TPR) repeat protein